MLQVCWGLFRDACLKPLSVSVTQLTTVWSLRCWVCWRVLLCCSWVYCMETTWTASQKKVMPSFVNLWDICCEIIPFFYFLRSDTPPSFYDMSDAISSLISQQCGSEQTDEEDCILLSEEHRLVLTCCWVSLKVVQKHTNEWTSKNATFISGF